MLKKLIRVAALSVCACVGARAAYAIDLHWNGQPHGTVSPDLSFVLDVMLSGARCDRSDSAMVQWEFFRPGPRCTDYSWATTTANGVLNEHSDSAAMQRHLPRSLRTLTVTGYPPEAKDQQVPIVLTAGARLGSELQVASGPAFVAAPATPR